MSALKNKCVATKLKKNKGQQISTTLFTRPELIVLAKHKHCAFCDTSTILIRNVHFEVTFKDTSTI